MQSVNLKEKAQQVKQNLPVVFLCLKSKDTPLAAKIIAGIAIAYALSPIDLIPDFIPILGYLDELILLPVLIALAIKLIPKETFAKYQKEAENLWAMGKPKKWYFGLPILCIWLLLIRGLINVYL